MAKIISALVLITVLNAQDTTNTALKWAVAGHVADIVTTEIGLANGFVELNPIMEDREIRIAFKIALVVMMYVYAELYPDDKRSQIVFALLSWMPVANNLYQIINHK